MLEDHLPLGKALDEFAAIAVTLSRCDPRFPRGPAPPGRDTDPEPYGAALWNPWIETLTGGQSSLQGTGFSTLMELQDQRLQRAQGLWCKNRELADTRRVLEVEAPDRTGPKWEALEAKQRDVSQKFDLLFARSDAFAIMLDLVGEGAVQTWEELREKAPPVGRPKYYTPRMLEYFAAVVDLIGVDEDFRGEKFQPDMKGTDYFREIAQRAPGIVGPQAPRQFFLDEGVWTKGAKLKDARPKLEEIALEAIAMRGRPGGDGDPAP